MILRFNVLGISLRVKLLSVNAFIMKIHNIQDIHYKKCKYKYDKVSALKAIPPERKDVIPISKYTPECAKYYKIHRVCYVKSKTGTLKNNSGWESLSFQGENGILGTG
jgi:hypothetical protein